MASIKGSQTEKNLLTSFAGESQARNRYTFAAKVAGKEGYPQIERIFLETADNERVHAHLMFAFLEGGPVEITATYPAGKTGTTIENLEAAAAGEHEEQSIIYPKFAEIAKQEGFGDVAGMYRMIAKAETWHENRYRALLDNLKNSTQFKKSTPTKWVCQKCGYIHEGLEAPGACACCKHPQKYFEVLAQNW
jgi:rubrerythrin